MPREGFYCYSQIMSPLAKALVSGTTRTLFEHAESVDDAVAEMICEALWTNKVPGTHSVVGGRAEVMVWRVRGGPVEDPDDTEPAYIANVQGMDVNVFTWLPDAQPATLETLVERLCPRDDRA